MPSPEGHLVIEMDVLPQFSNVRGALQGGLIAVLVDVCAGRLAYDSCDHENGFSTATSDLTIHFLSPVVVGPARADAWIVRQGAIHLRAAGGSHGRRSRQQAGCRVDDRLHGAGAHDLDHASAPSLDGCREHGDVLRSDRRRFRRRIRVVSGRHGDGSGRWTLGRPLRGPSTRTSSSLAGRRAVCAPSSPSIPLSSARLSAVRGSIRTGRDARAARRPPALESHDGKGGSRRTGPWGWEGGHHRRPEHREDAFPHSRLCGRRRQPGGALHHRRGCRDDAG